MKDKILSIVGFILLLALSVLGLVTIRLSFDPGKTLQGASVDFVLGAILLFVVGIVLWVICDEVREQQFQSIQEKISQMQSSIRDSVGDDICDVLDGQQELRELVRSIQAELAELKLVSRLSWLQKLLRRR
jgi:hypothetical protein